MTNKLITSGELGAMTIAPAILKELNIVFATGALFDKDIKNFTLSVKDDVTPKEAILIQSMLIVASAGANYDWEVIINDGGIQRHFETE